MNNTKFENTVKDILEKVMSWERYLPPNYNPINYAYAEYYRRMKYSTIERWKKTAHGIVETLGVELK